MPPSMVRVAIPVITLSPERKLQLPTRAYNDGPLSIKLSEHAPRKAIIVDRVAEPDKVVYTLEVGGVQIDEVGIDEILDYVSPFDLEQFENRRFEEEREIIKIARQQADFEMEQRRERQRQRAKTKGTVIFEEVEDGFDESSIGTIMIGKHGRARPTYKHLFKQSDTPELSSSHETGKRRRRKRHPVTRELMPLSDEDVESEPFQVGRASARTSPGPAIEPPKRRRRKRDPVTGELLPLLPLEQAFPPDNSHKRPRRRRHPVTGELMPLGWRYSPEEKQQSKQSPPPSARGDLHSMHRLSISQEQHSKRLKLDSGVSSEDPLTRLSTKASNTDRKPQERLSISPEGTATEDEMETSEHEDGIVPNTSQAQTSVARRTSILSPTLNLTFRSPSRSDSPKQVTLASFFEKNRARTYSETSETSTPSDDHHQSRNLVQHPKTNITTSINNKALTTREILDEEDDNDAEDAYVVDDILEHALSDPHKTPGGKSVMLYKVKWEGYSELTWEPEDSFADASIIQAYRKRVGIDKEKTRQRVPARHAKANLASQQRQAAFSTNATIASNKVGQNVVDSIGNVGESNEDSYEVEAIRDHHMSDPRTHPGKPAVMLYLVKWLGYEELTWEPRSSFTNTALLDAYEKRVGLK